MKCIYPVFHILLLEPAPQNVKITENIEIEEDENEYEVEQVLGYK